MNARQYAVPYLLSFDPAKRDGYGRAGYCIGNGEAGWAVYKSDDAREVLKFAEALPQHSRMPAHDRAVSDCREGMLRDAAPDLLAALQAMMTLVLEMGATIRELDEEGEHSELWTNDGNYVPSPEFRNASDAIAKATGA